MIFLRLFVATLFMLIGILLLLKGYEHGSKSYELVKGSASASGEIVKIVPYLSQKAGKSSALQYFPDVKYIPAGGKEIIFRSQVTSRADHYKPGDKVKVLYKKDNPKDAVIGSFSALWAIALIFGFGGALVILFSSWFFRQAFKRESKTQTE